MKCTPIDVPEMERLFYIKDDFLYTKFSRGNLKADSLAGCYEYRGNGRHYIRVNVKGYGKLYAHRLIWTLRNGRDPGNMEIDHKENILVDFKGKKVLSNAKSNLRLATHQQNLANNPNAKGVHWNKACERWRAEVMHKGVKYHLGYFFCYEKARAAYIKAKNEFAGRFTPTDIRDTGLEMT